MDRVHDDRLSRRRRRSWARCTATGTAVVLLAMGGSVAYANWAATGSGSSQASSVSAVTLTVSNATAAADLYPGGSGKVSFTVTNPNSYPVVLTAASFGTVTSDDATACPASNITTSNKTGLSISVAAGATSSLQTLANAVSMAISAPDGCQGRTFIIGTTLTGQSA